MSIENNQNQPTVKEIHERLRNVSWNPLRVCRKNEQNQLIISGDLPQGRTITNGCTHGVAQYLY
jgi:hypothetical protein